jgi:hypothetical protein
VLQRASARKYRTMLFAKAKKKKKKKQDKKRLNNHGGFTQ